MKRKLRFLLSFLALFFMVGCGISDGASIPTNGLKKSTEVVIGQDYSAGDYSFSLFKGYCTDKLQCVSGEGSYYESDNGMQYIDIVLTFSNNSSADFNVDDSISGSFESEDGTTYESILLACEERNDRISSYSSITPLSTSKLHIGYKVPTNVTSGIASFTIMEEKFYVNFNSENELSNKISVALNSEIKSEDYASYKITKINYTKDLLPPVTSSFYTHYEVDNPSSDSYMAVYFDLSNMSANSLDSDEIVSMRVKYDNKYEYTGFMVLIEKDKTGFDYANITSVDPLETRQCVYLFEVPDKVKDMNYEITMYFDGVEYSYSE